VGCRGAQVTVATVKPDIAIVFEGCPADDTFSEEYMIQTGLKRGPMLRHIDARMITNPRFQRFALDVAREYNIPVQDSVRTGGATNGSVIHLHSPAVPVIVIGIPVRYIHTHNCIASYADYQNGVKLAVAVIKHLNSQIIESF
jgi:putative aminopeptidase FrvX